VFTALLDTCVLWPSTQRDFLLSLAAEGMYRPIWSARILAELEYAEAQKWVEGGHADEGRRRAEHLVFEMRRAFNDAEVVGWEGLEGSYGLPDRDDEHVVAASVVGGAGAIVTLNFRDFPPDRLPFGIDVLSPAQFALNTVALNPGAALRAVEKIAGRSGQSGPLWSDDDVLDILERRYRMEKAVDLLRQAR
jgi:PIN domain